MTAKLVAVPVELGVMLGVVVPVPEADDEGVCVGVGGGGATESHESSLHEVQ